MESIRTVKNVDEETWNELKVISKRNKINIGKMIKLIVNEHKSKNNFWNRVLNNKKILSDAEAEAIMESVKESRKEKGFRE